MPPPTFEVVNDLFNQLHKELFDQAESTNPNRRCLTGKEQDELHRLASSIDDLHHRYYNILDPAETAQVAKWNAYDD